MLTEQQIQLVKRMFLTDIEELDDIYKDRQLLLIIYCRRVEGGGASLVKFWSLDIRELNKWHMGLLGSLGAYMVDIKSVLVGLLGQTGGIE